MKKIIFSMFFLIMVVVSFGYKYIFLFVGDGMGMNHLTIANSYKLYNYNESLNIFNLENLSFMNTVSLNGVTDSAASITAMLSFEKTYNDRINIDKEDRKLSPITFYLKDLRYKIGLISTATIVDPTIAAAFTRINQRREYQSISKQLSESNVDLVISGGRAFVETNDNFLFSNNFLNEISNSNEIITLYYSNFPFLLDSQNRVTLNEMLKYTLEKFEKQNFFLIIEGARIDHASHANDAHSMVKEILDLDEAVKTALEFYNKYPEDTLIIVTADHETGGLSLGDGFIRISSISNQKYSYESLASVFLNSENYEDFISKTNIDFDLRKEYYLTEKKSPVSYTSSLIKAYLSYYNDHSGIGWTTHGHTMNYVPVFSVGYKYPPLIDNTELLLHLIK